MPPLLTALQAFNAAIVHAVVAGNDNGRVVAEWTAALGEALPNCRIDPVEVPCRPDAADVALIMALGRAIDAPERPADTLVMLSRDHILHAAAECAQQQGVRAILAWAAGATPPSRPRELPTLLLSGGIDSAGVGEGSSGKPDTDDPVLLVRELRARCKPHDDGSYPASYVGHALSQMGYKTKAERDRALARIPHILAISSGATKRYRLPATGSRVAP
jgi:hypothetical protein